MASNPAHKLRWLLTGGLLVVLVLCLILSWTTRQAMSPLVQRRPNNRVDLRPWQTAEALAAFATSAEESRYARAAKRLADHEVDQAFAAALREATLRRPTLTGRALELAKRVAALKQVVADDQAQVHALTEKDPNDDLDVAKAQLGLDTDQLADAQQDLARAGGDDGGRIQQELAAHEAAMRKNDAENGPQNTTAFAALPIGNTVAASISEWFKLRTLGGLLDTASAETQTDATALTAQHNRIEASAATVSGGASKAERLASLGDQATRSQLLSVYDDRIATERQLITVYGKWSDQVALQQRMIVHVLMQSFALIAFILICVITLDALAMHVVHRPALDTRRIQTLGNIVKSAIRFVGVVLILLVVFGTPSQMPTILGLATAGMTVVLQDFIVAFFGWFVLMGKNGIHIGDLVEINGVAGEVVSVGLFRTTMLEIANASDMGRATGRRITFVNSFAFKGQFFNYSTSGQWMWDEIRVGIPAGREAYSTVELVRKTVAEETAKDTPRAEEELTRINRRFTAAPAVDMRPGPSGIDLIVRYVTRAQNRSEVKNRLYEKLLSLLRKSPDEQPAG